MGEKSTRVEALAGDRQYDLYLITNLDIAFVQDGLHRDEAVRRKMHERFIAVLEAQQTPYELISGSQSERLTAAINAIATKTNVRKLSTRPDLPIRAVDCQ